MKGAKGENKMRINKEYNLEEIIKEVEHGIEVTKQKSVSINILTAQAVVDILKTIPEMIVNGMKLSAMGNMMKMIWRACCVNLKGIAKKQLKMES